jgi:hypothetical protein
MVPVSVVVSVVPSLLIMLEVIDDRSQLRSTVVVTQPPVEDWHTALTAGDPTLADAILDRLVHNAHRLPLGAVLCVDANTTAWHTATRRKPISALRSIDGTQHSLSQTEPDQRSSSDVARFTYRPDGTASSTAAMRALYLACTASIRANQLIKRTTEQLS